MELRTDFSSGESKKPEPSATEKRLQKLAWVLDSAVPLPGGFRLGLDSLIGFIPGIGDGATALISSYIMAEGIKAKAPKTVLIRMMGNVATDTVIGSIPFLGDLFDIGFRSNVRNVNLLKEYLNQPSETSRSSAWILILVMIVLFALLIGLLALSLAIVRALIGLF